MTWNVYFGSGRAKCRICDRTISKKELQVNCNGGSGIHTVNQNVHLECLEDRGDVAVAERG